MHCSSRKDDGKHRYQYYSRYNNNYLNCFVHVFLLKNRIHR